MSAKSRRPGSRRHAPGCPSNGRAITRPTACSPSITMAGLTAGGDELRLGQHVDVGGELEHRVGRGVEDHLAGALVMLAVVLEHHRAAVGGVDAEAQPRRLLQRGDDRGGEAVGIGRQRPVENDPHQLPVAGGRLLARPLGGEAAVQHRRRGGRHALQLDERAQPEGLQRGQLESSGQLREVAECVRADIAVGGRVGQRPDAAGVHHDDRCAGHATDAYQGVDH